MTTTPTAIISTIIIQCTHCMCRCSSTQVNDPGPPVVSAAAGNATGKQVRGMCQQVGGHEGSIGVATDSYPACVRYPSPLQLLHICARSLRLSHGKQAEQCCTAVCSGKPEFRCFRLLGLNSANIQLPHCQFYIQRLTRACAHSHASQMVLQVGRVMMVQLAVQRLPVKHLQA